MSNSIAFRDVEDQQKSILNDLGKIFIPCLDRKLRQKGGLEFVLLYGSRARGDYRWNSDIDIIVCSEAFEGIRTLDRPDVVYSCPQRGAIEPICYTPREIWQALEDNRLTILDALETGIVLYEQGVLLQQLRQCFANKKSQGLLTQFTIAGNKMWRVEN